MRLLQARKSSDELSPLVLVEFEGQHVPPYAILSHTWNEDEVLLADINDKTASLKQGYRKIQYAMNQACHDGYKYVWVDTCCIDKTSSAELSEAINSMYAWYQNAGVCYAYLFDVSAFTDPTIPDSEFARSKWFTRGWTLQELLAPQKVTFYSTDWQWLGEKHELAQCIDMITGIDFTILTGHRDFDTVSIATRMSWAAFRQTTRIEDSAYCLMGIFSVNMPMLYGEGSKAFQRLQEEIMKNSDDQSLFAWVDSAIDAEQPHGLLADKPAQFAASASIMTYTEWDGSPPFEMTNRGLKIQLRLTIWTGSQFFVAALNCPTNAANKDAFIAIYLKRLPVGAQQFARVRCGELTTVSGMGKSVSIFVRQKFAILSSPIVYPPQARMYLSLSTQRHSKATNGGVITGYRVAGSTGINHKQWSFEKVPRRFEIMRQPNWLALSADFSAAYQRQRILVLIGTYTANDIGFFAREQTTSELPSLTNLLRLYSPVPAGTSTQLENHSVRIDSQLEFEDDKMIFDISISIEPRYTQPMVITSVVETDQNNSDGASSTVVAKKHGFSTSC